MKVNSAYEPSGPDQDGAYPGFFNMKRLGVLLLPPGWDASLYSCSKVEELRVKCLDQEYNTMSWPGIEPRLLDLPDKCTREEAIAPLTMRRIVKYIITTKSSSIPGIMFPCYKLLNI